MVDPEAAKIVRLIFEKAADGLKTREIARILNEMGVLPPWEQRQKRRQGSSLKLQRIFRKNCIMNWNCSKNRR